MYGFFFFFYKHVQLCNHHCHQNRIFAPTSVPLCPFVVSSSSPDPRKPLICFLSLQINCAWLFISAVLWDHPLYLLSWGCLGTGCFSATLRAKERDCLPSAPTLRASRLLYAWISLEVVHSKLKFLCFPPLFIYILVCCHFLNTFY